METCRASFGTFCVLNSAVSIREECWRHAFSRLCMDGRYYHLTEKTLPGNFIHRYMVLFDHQDRMRAIQPMFFTDQDLTAGLPHQVTAPVHRIRQWSPRFLVSKMLMVGCAAGEGHLGYDEPQAAHWVARALHEALEIYAKRQKVSLVVLKDFPSEYRGVLASFSNNGYSRVPSMPAAALELNYDSFEHYASTTLSHATRKNLRRKFRKSNALAEPIQMEIHHDITPMVDEIYPLYLQVYARAELKFEKLSKEYFCEVGRTMPERAHFFVWKHQGRIIAFSFCMLHDGVLNDCYLGLDYAVALKLHLYFVTFRDVMQWCTQNGIHCYYSAPLGYDPKLHLRFELRPLDLYVWHTSRLIAPFFRWVLKFLQPTRHDPILRRFCNANEI